MTVPDRAVCWAGAALLAGLACLAAARLPSLDELNRLFLNGAYRYYETRAAGLTPPPDVEESR